MQIRGIKYKLKSSYPDKVGKTKIFWGSDG